MLAFQTSMKSSSSFSTKRFFSAKPFNAVFLGAPGVGKGTFAKRLAPKYNVEIISTGDIIRTEIKNKTEIGMKVKEISERGDLVPDEIVTEMAKNRLKTMENGWILDGFPRTVGQAEALSEFASLDFVLNLELRRDVLTEKICARRVCDGCGENYNVADINRDGIVMTPLLPKVEGVCDKCGCGLKQRDDDTVEVVQNRLEIYDSQTLPLVDFYKKRGLLLDFDIKKGVDDLPKLVELIDERLD
eukprot:271324_1